MKVIETALAGVLIIEPKIFGDARGYFYESYQAKRYAEHGLPSHFVQDNISHSARGVLRGLHHQKKQTQGKLVWVTAGSVFDVIVDIRRSSPTFGQSIHVMLDDQDHRQVYIPPGCAHGFCVSSEQATFMYKCTDYYDPSSELSVLWNDPDLKINWPMQDNLIISLKDQQGRRLRDIPADELPL